MTTRRVIPALCVLALAVACGDGAPRTAADSQAAHVRDVAAAGGIVDSILPIEEHLRRFRATLTRQPDTLASASPSLDALVARWATAVAANDSAAFDAMVIDAAEFAWLFYPDSRMSKPPYEAPPGLLWGQLLASSNDGVRAVLKRYGGQPLRVDTVTCPDALVEGANRLHERCVVTVRSGTAAKEERRLFGTILERDGRFKFVGLASEL